MNKNYLNEELNSMKYLFDYQRGKVISEQTMTIYYKGADGKVGTLNGPQALPAGAIAISQQEYNTAMSTTQTTTVVQPTTPTTTTPTTPTTPQPSLGSDALELQKLLNSKYQAGLKEDSRVGQLTIAAALKALGGTPKGKTNVGATTTTTTTVKTAEASTENSQTPATQPAQGPQPAQQVDKGHNSVEAV